VERAGQGENGRGKNNQIWQREKRRQIMPLEKIAKRGGVGTKC